MASSFYYESFDIMIDEFDPFDRDPIKVRKYRWLKDFRE